MFAPPLIVISHIYRAIKYLVSKCQNRKLRKKFSNDFREWVILIYVRGRSQLSTFMKVYTAYARGEGVWDHRTLSPRKSTFIFNHWQCILKYYTSLESGQYAHICWSFVYNNHLKHFSWRRNIRKATFFGRKQWRHTSHRGATDFAPLALILVHKSH